MWVLTNSSEREKGGGGGGGAAHHKQLFPFPTRPPAFRTQMKEKKKVKKTKQKGKNESPFFPPVPFPPAFL